MSSANGKAQTNSSTTDEDPPSYTSYLQLDKLLECQKLSKISTDMHDEHLFIVTHQAYELWFKQIIFELDSIREIFTAPIVSEKLTLVIISRLDRIALIFKLLLYQFEILETMTPLDFVNIRTFLKTSSGFQSLQFRLLENKFGLPHENRINYNQRDYQAVFADEQSKEVLNQSEKEASLFDLVMRWLERTPCLSDKYFNFWQKYKASVKRWLDDEYLESALNETNEDEKKVKMAAYEKYKDAFEAALDEDRYNAALQRGDRRLTYQAFQGAMMISVYRDEPRFHQPFQILKTLTDIDSLFTKWRYNHVMMVQRMIGSKFGTGGSSGYQYLRATVSDRYKVFVDLFNLSTYLVPRRYSPLLTHRMQRNLSVIAVEQLAADEHGFDDDDDDEDTNDDKTAKNLVKLLIY